MEPFSEPQAAGWRRAYIVTCACGNRLYWSRRVEAGIFYLAHAYHLALDEGWQKHNGVWQCNRCLEEEKPVL